MLWSKPWRTNCRVGCVGWVDRGRDVAGRCWSGREGDWTVVIFINRVQASSESACFYPHQSVALFTLFDFVSSNVSDISPVIYTVSRIHATHDHSDPIVWCSECNQTARKCYKNTQLLLKFTPVADTPQGRCGERLDWFTANKSSSFQP